MRAATGIALLLGVALFTAVIVWQGLDDIARLMAISGWGLVVVALFHLLPLILDSYAWWLLFDRPRPGFMAVLRARWVCESINNLLPAGQVGGDVVRARWLAQHRCTTGAVAGATVVVDITLTMITLVLFALAGIALLIVLLGHARQIWTLGVGIAVLALLMGLFYRLQRRGLFDRLSQLASKLFGERDWLGGDGGARALDGTINALYQRRGRVAIGACWRLAGWAVGTGEIWLALYFLGHPVSLAEALMFEALGQTVHSAAFAIPGALGVQEGAYIMLGGLVGLPPGVALAVSLTRRVRELILGVPGLLIWQFQVGGRLRHHLRSHKTPGG